MSSYIYAIKCGDFYKIGATRNPKQRLEALDHWSPLKMDIEVTYEVPDNVLFKIERAVHRRLEAKGLRHKYEWFHKESWGGDSILPMLAEIIERMKSLTSGEIDSDSLQLWNIRNNMNSGVTKTKLWNWLQFHEFKRAASYFQHIKVNEPYIWADVEAESGRKLAEFLSN